MSKAAASVHAGGELAPIALFAYNRPLHTRNTLEALARNGLAAESDLFVFSDAPKRPEAAASVREVRSYLATIRGFKSVTIVERQENFGLSRSIIEGVTGLCERYGRVIVLEDDLVVSVHFLEYMNLALARYEHDAAVMQIAGYMFPVDLPLSEDALFLPFISSWGWATWRRAWVHFDPHALGYERLRADPALRWRFDLNGSYSYFKMLTAQQQGRVDSWAIRWYLSVFLRDGLALYPKKTLVNNAGFDGSGVNCAISRFDQDALEAEVRVRLLPEVIAVSSLAPTVMRNMVLKRSLGVLLNRLLTVFKRYWSSTVAVKGRERL